MMQWRHLAFIPFLAAIYACPGNANDQGTTVCNGQSRARMDCASEIKYDGISTAGGVSVLSLGSAKAKFEDVAIRRINENVEKYVASQSHLCKEYNACVVDDQKYHSEAKELRARLQEAGSAAVRLGSAESEGDRKRILSEIYEKTVPASARPEEVEFKMLITAELPAELASVKPGSFVVRPNEPLPTGAKVSFTFEVSNAAHLYIFQNSPATGLAVLFPDARIGTTNPLGARAPRRIPDGTQSFRLNDKDLGTEWIYVAVSTKPIDVLQAALKRVSGGQVTALAQDSTLSAFAKIAPGRAIASCKTRALELIDDNGPPPCMKTRGLVLDDPENGAARASMTVRTDPGDDAIVKAFPFEHVTTQGLAAAHERFAAPTAEGRKSRGIIME